MQIEDLEQIIDVADSRALYLNQLGHLKEKFRISNTMTFEGHVFELTPHFVSYVLLQFMSSQHDGDVPIILIDRDGEPVVIPNTAEFVDDMQDRHTEALNDYADAYKRLRDANDKTEMLEV